MNKMELFKVGFGTVVVGTLSGDQQEQQQQIQRPAVGGFCEAVRNNAEF